MYRQIMAVFIYFQLSLHDYTREMTSPLLLLTCHAADQLVAQPVSRCLIPGLASMDQYQAYLHKPETICKNLVRDKLRTDPFPTSPSMARLSSNSLTPLCMDKHPLRARLQGHKTTGLTPGSICLYTVYIYMHCYYGLCTETHAL